MLTPSIGAQFILQHLTITYVYVVHQFITYIISESENELNWLTLKLSHLYYN